MTRAELKSLTRTELASMAKSRCVDGWYQMNKAELVTVLITHARRNGAKARSTTTPATTRRSPAKRSAMKRTPAKAGSNGHSNHHASNGVNGKNGNGKATKATHSKPVAASNGARRRKFSAEDNGSSASPKERLIVTACNPYWLHVYWELKTSTLARAEAAMGLEWHSSVPIIRLFDASNDDARTSVTWLRDIEIEGDAANWFIQVNHPPTAFRVHLGYRAPSGKFVALARSGTVTTPRPGLKLAGNLLTDRGSDSDSGEQAHHAHTSMARRLPSPPLVAQGRRGKNGDEAGSVYDSFEFALHAELVVHGTTHPEADLSLSGRRIALRPDGTFSQRVNLPNGRQVIPVVAVNPSGANQRTIVLAVESNTKELEPKVFDEV